MSPDLPHKPDNLPSNWIPANWPAPERVWAGITTRTGGFSNKPYDSFNLALHVGDDTGMVQRNRDKLRRRLNLPSEPLWLEQVHGCDVIAGENGNNFKADGCITDRAGIVCTVLTADCIPLLMCNRSGTMVAAAHVGWRGLCRGIISNTVGKFSDNKDRLMAWIGPHIRSRHYLVREDVKNTCTESLAAYNGSAFEDAGNGHWHADLEKLVRNELGNLGVSEIFSCNKCTYSDSKTFYSYRRNNNTGRMASMIWIEV